MEYVLIRQSLFVRINRCDELSVVNCIKMNVIVTRLKMFLEIECIYVHMRVIWQ